MVVFLGGLVGRQACQFVCMGGVLFLNFYCVHVFFFNVYFVFWCTQCVEVDPLWWCPLLQFPYT